MIFLWFEGLTTWLKSIKFYKSPINKNNVIIKEIVGVDFEGLETWWNDEFEGDRTVIRLCKWTCFNNQLWFDEFEGDRAQ